MPRIGEHGDVDVRGSANFMKGQFGAPGSNLTRVTTAGGHTMTLNRESAPYLKGFVEELEKGGAPIRSIGGYNYRNIAGSRRLSQHAMGNATTSNSSGAASPRQVSLDGAPHPISSPRRAQVARVGDERFGGLRSSDPAASVQHEGSRGTALRLNDALHASAARPLRPSRTS